MDEFAIPGIFNDPLGPTDKLSSAYNDLSSVLEIPRHEIVSILQNNGREGSTSLEQRVVTNSSAANVFSPNLRVASSCIPTSGLSPNLRLASTCILTFPLFNLETTSVTNRIHVEEETTSVINRIHVEDETTSVINRIHVEDETLSTFMKRIKDLEQVLKTNEKATKGEVRDLLAHEWNRQSSTVEAIITRCKRSLDPYIASLACKYNSLRSKRRTPKYL